MVYITIKKYPFWGFYVVNTKLRCADYCHWNLFVALQYFAWHLGVNPKYAFVSVRIKKWIRKTFNHDTRR